MTEHAQKKYTIKKLFAAMAAGALIGSAGSTVFGAVAESMSPYKQTGRDQVQAATVLKEKADGMAFEHQDHTVASRALVDAFEQTCTAANPDKIEAQNQCLTAASSELFKNGANNLVIATSPKTNVAFFAVIGATLGALACEFMALAQITSALRNRRTNSNLAAKDAPSC